MPNLSARSRIPSYRLHKPSGLAVVRLAGRDLYLGQHGTPDSRAAYKRVIGEWLAGESKFLPPEQPSVASAAKPRSAFGSDAATITVNELILRYLDHASLYYVKNGRPTGELHNIEHSMRILAPRYGRTEVREFGPLALKAVRVAMVEADLCRTVVNGRINRIRRMFKWGVEEQLVPPAVLHGLLAIAPLKHGRCAAREAEPVRAVPSTRVEPVLQVAPPQIAAMIRLQLLTGMRPGEVVQMRTCDVDRSGHIWVYRPSQFKTQHHDRLRVIHLGPQAQQVLRPWLRASTDEFLFQPREVMEFIAKARRMERRTPMTPSQRARLRLVNPKKQPGNHYTTHAYGHAIRQACTKAFPHPELDAVSVRSLSPEQRAELARWRAEHHWSPNQLRHTAATMLRREFGIEAARVVLGHGSAQITEIYAEQDLGRAKEIMARVG